MVNNCVFFMQMTKISGGISNLLVKVGPPASSGLRPVAVKVFGAKTEIFIDREVELKTLLKLNDAGFGAQVGYPMQAAGLAQGSRPSGSRPQPAFLHVSATA